MDAKLFHEVIQFMEIPFALHSTEFSSKESLNRENINEDLKSKVIITDRLALLGVEMDTVILSVDPNDNYIHQYIVEAIGRFVRSLYIVVKNVKNVLKNILERWRKNKLIETTLVKFCDDKACDQDDFLCTISTTAEESVHSIHTDQLSNSNRLLEKLWRQG